jgi:hypothetical protein
MSDEKEKLQAAVEELEEIVSEPKVLRIAQPQCSAVVWFGDEVVIQCSQPSDHDPSVQHSITLRWQQDGMRVSIPEKEQAELYGS